MNNYNFSELEKVMHQWAANDNFSEPESAAPNNVTLHAGSTEMLRVAEDGFYVRGSKVPVDGKEAETVYKAFKEFLVWAELHKN